MYSTEQIGAKFYLNGFPKCGLHLLELLMRPLAQPMQGEEMHAPWVSSHKDNSWSFDQYPRQQVTFAIGRTLAGYYTKGHLAYDPVFDQFMNWLGIVHIFVYRDLRDAAVSQAHVFWHGGGEPGKSNSDVNHPALAEFRKMKDFDEVLSAVIQGYDIYPGVMARWELYKEWLQKSWVLSVRFEDMVKNRAGVAEQILDHMTKRLSSILYVDPEIKVGTKIKLVKAMMLSSHKTHRSPTFRKGAVGDWRECFTDKHIDQFKSSDLTNEMVRMGYENEIDWTR